MYKMFDDILEEMAYSYLDQTKEVLLSGDEKQATAMLKSITDILYDLGWSFGAFLSEEKYEDTLGKLWDKKLGLYAEEEEEEEEEEYAILYNSSDGYMSPFFFYDEEGLNNISEVRFYPDKDSRLYILKDGSQYWTD